MIHKISGFVLTMISTLLGSTGQVMANTDILDHTLETISAPGAINLKEAYSGKVILAVNTASACGFTPQLEGLEKLHTTYQEQGLVVLGFPSNDFFQEKKVGDDIVEFCKLNYGVTFPLFRKSSVRGKNANPFYQSLIQASGKAPKWNFFKYLIDREGQVVGVYSSKDKPLGGQLEKDIQALL